MDTRDMALILDRRTKVDSVTTTIESVTTTTATRDTSRATLTHSITSLLTLLICLWAIAML